jgi:hypothetical protein
VALGDAKDHGTLDRGPTDRQVFPYRDSSMTCDERLMGFAYDSLDKHNRLPSGQPSACCSKHPLRDKPCKKVRGSSYVWFYNGVVSYLISRSDRRLGEEQPPLPPLKAKVRKLFLAFSLRPSLRMASEQGFISETRAQALQPNPCNRR